MFTEFLHPELVLFGDFLNPKLGCSHHVECRDGEITVHQTINRAGLSEQQIKAMNQIQQQEKKYRQMDEYDNDLDKEEAEYLRREEEEDGEDYEDEDEGEYGRNDGAYYEQEQNPYAEDYYTYNIAKQFSPEQLAAIFNSNNPTPPKIEGVPFSKQSKKKKHSQEAEHENDEDEDWETQEQIEDYVTNEMLEEAGGNFAADL